MAIHKQSNINESLYSDEWSLYPPNITTTPILSLGEVYFSDVTGTNQEVRNLIYRFLSPFIVPNKRKLDVSVRDAIEVLFNRTYVTPLAIDPGFITEELYYDLYVWNADSENLSELTSISVDDDDGLSLSYPSLPLDLARGADEVLELTIELEGPPVQNSTYTIVAGGLTYSVSVSGTRAIGISEEPNWDRGVKMVFEFFTAIGSNPKLFKEQRRPLSNFPWRNISGQWDVTGLVGQKFLNTLQYGVDKIFVVPIYSEQLVCATISTGSYDITPTTDYSEFYNLQNNCTHMILIDNENDLVEIKEIDTLGASTISFVTLISSAFAAKSTFIYPVVFSVLKSMASTSQSSEVEEVNIEFREYKKSG